MQLIQTSKLGLCEGLETDVGERIAAPESECIVEHPLGLVELCALERVGAFACERLEPIQVELAGTDPQAVATRGRLDSLEAEFLAQARDVELHALAGVLGRSLAPEPVEDLVARQRRVPVQEQQGEERGFLPGSELKPPTVVVQDFQHAEPSELHSKPTVPPPVNRAKSRTIYRRSTEAHR